MSRQLIVDCNGSVVYLNFEVSVKWHLKTLQACLHEMCTTFRYEQKAVVWLRVVYGHVLRFIVLEAKMACSCFPKTKAI